MTGLATDQVQRFVSAPSERAHSKWSTQPRLMRLCALLTEPGVTPQAVSHAIKGSRSRGVLSELLKIGLVPLARHCGWLCALPPDQGVKISVLHYTCRHNHCRRGRARRRAQRSPLTRQSISGAGRIQRRCAGCEARTALGSPPDCGYSDKLRHRRTPQRPAEGPSAPRGYPVGIGEDCGRSVQPLPAQRSWPFRGASRFGV